MDRIDFSRNARIYDRRHGSAVELAEVSRLVAVAELQPGSRVLDIGAGTGRVAIPLAASGCMVVGLEPGAGMVDQLQAKDEKGLVLAVLGEGSRLPFPSNCFDAVVIARLLYLTPDWRAILEEANRALAVGGRLLHQWGNGEADEEWVRIREEARRLFELAGVQSPFHPGARSESEITDYLASLQFSEASNVPIDPGPKTTIREFLRRLVDGELSYIWNVPRDIQARCLPELEAWAVRTFDLDRSVAMPRELRWTLYRKYGT